MPIFIGHVRVGVHSPWRLRIHVIKEDLLLYCLKEDLMVACTGEPASLDYVITSISLSVFIAFPGYDNGEDRRSSTFDASCCPN